MANMTMAIPDELHSKMRKHSEIKWAEIARQVFREKVNMLEAEKEPLRAYAYKRLAEEGDDAEKLFKF
ncbi:MAG: hypothetical protein JW744_00910 [Candidatus Diapherotrites archaeon]|uniref:Uncharacterized protein n=1 Tax=Candidatus Iainarchaeum sp. TaxID=3101447 RepID=A0A939C8J7_9ARCH|nr:hypothetical protein [Candidatus Diapherotrites archaeon]